VCVCVSALSCALSCKESNHSLSLTLYIFLPCSSPFDFTFVCPTEIVAFSDAVEKFSKINTKILAISTDSQHTHLAWIRTDRTNGGLGPINIPLVADVSKDISRAYGVLVDTPGDDMYGAALRGLFIIDPSKVVRSVQINDDQAGRSVEETFRLVQAFQHADKHGVVCPAGWTPGKNTIVPDPDASKSFFKEL
jgi:alkyl hydroperoxide reductase subunit AhpC